MMERGEGGEKAMYMKTALRACEEEKKAKRTG